MIYITFERWGPKFFKYYHYSASLAHSLAAASLENKMATMQHKIICVYQRRTWDEFKRVLSVAHESQSVERAENLEYHNQLSGVCCAVYCSTESIFLNHPVFRSILEQRKKSDISFLHPSIFYMKLKPSALLVFAETSYGKKSTEHSQRIDRHHWFLNTVF